MHHVAGPGDEPVVAKLSTFFHSTVDDNGVAVRKHSIKQLLAAADGP